MKPMEDTMTPGATQQGSELATDNTAIRPFRVDVFGAAKNPCRLVHGVASLPLGAPVELEIIFEVGV
jgi:hypothetical protein